MNICWNRIRLALVALACVGLSGCDWVLLDSKGMVGLAQRDLILICIGLMLIVVIPAIVLTFVFAWRYRAGNTKGEIHAGLVALHQGGDRGLGRAADHCRPGGDRVEVDPRAGPVQAAGRGR
jgi:uncharacterized membrane protein